MPLISVITPLFNGARFVAETIASVLDQEMADFEYLLVDDASTDESHALASAAAACDERIRLLRNPVNQGISRTLNRALALARGDYVAILDHDDLALPQRFTLQSAYLDAHPNVALVGSQVQLIDETGAALNRHTLPLHPGVVRWDLLFRCSVLHSAAMMRRRHILDVGGYALHQRFAVEVDLFWRLAQRAAVANLPHVLAARRSSAGQTSQIEGDVQRNEVILWQWALYRNWLKIDVEPAAVHALYAANRDLRLADGRQLMIAADLLEAIYDAYLARVQPDAETRMLLAREVAWKLLVYATSSTPQTGVQTTELRRRALHYDSALTSRARVQARLEAALPHTGDRFAGR